MATMIAGPCIEEYFGNQFNRALCILTSPQQWTQGKEFEWHDNSLLHGALWLPDALQPDMWNDLLFSFRNITWAKNGWATVIESKVLAFLRLRWTDEQGVCDVEPSQKGVCFILHLIRLAKYLTAFHCLHRKPWSNSCGALSEWYVFNFAPCPGIKCI